MTSTLPGALAAVIRRRLLRWFDAARRELPWRGPAGKVDPYRVWISEAMLQQTQVATVIPYYGRFLARFPTLRALADAPEEEVLAAWSGLGYYARARALCRAAREALARHGGLPRDVEALRALPGFGPYTAGAVASIAFGIATPAVDGNAGRVLARLLLVAADPHTARFRDGVWRGAEALVHGARRPGDLNQALIELGALVCRAGAPRCERCPVESLCRARAAGREGAIPRPRRRPRRVALTLAVGVCVWRGRVLLVRRAPGGLFGGMWGPPAVEVAAGGDPVAAISSEIHREPSVPTGEFRFLGSVERTLTHRDVTLLVHVARIRTLPPKGAGWRLATPSGLESLAIPAAFRAALALIGRGGWHSDRKRVVSAASQSGAWCVDADGDPPEPG